MVQLALSCGACVSHVDKAHFKTALQVACEAQSVDCVQLLLDAGADPNVQCENGRTPLHEGEEFEVSIFICSFAIILLCASPCVGRGDIQVFMKALNVNVHIFLSDISADW